MKTFVVTPVGPGANLDHLAECLASVGAQTVQATHVLVFDGDGEGSTCFPDADVIVLPRNTNDIGSTPRTVGAVYAWGRGAEAVAFLDADCLYLPDHLERLIAFHHRTGKPAVCSGRSIIDYHRTRQADCRETAMTAPERFHDTNTYLFTRAAIGLSYTFGTLTGRQEHLIGDRILTERAGVSLSCHYHPTLLYRSTHRFHYHTFGWPAPEGLTLKDIAAEQLAYTGSDNVRDQRPDAN